MTKQVMALAKAQALVYGILRREKLGRPGEDSPAFLDAMVALGLSPEARDREVARSMLMIFIIKGLVSDSETTGDLGLGVSWEEERFLATVAVLNKHDYSLRVIETFIDRLGIHTPTLDEVSDAFLRLLKVTREQVRVMQDALVMFDRVRETFAARGVPEALPEDVPRAKSGSTTPVFLSRLVGHL